jgi:hypothetical protein
VNAHGKKLLAFLHAYLCFFKRLMEQFSYIYELCYRIAPTSPFPPVLSIWKSSVILLNYVLAATPLPSSSTGSVERFWNITELCPSCGPPPFPPVLDLWKSSGILLNYALAATPLFWIYGNFRLLLNCCNSSGVSVVGRFSGSNPAQCRLFINGLTTIGKVRE